MLPSPSRARRIPFLLLFQLGLVVAAVVLYVNLRRTAERQTHANDALRAENLRLRQEAARAAGQLKEAERERLLAASPRPTEPRRVEPQIDTDPNGIIERVIRLKSYLAHHPERGIPEMRLLTDDEWMQQTKDADLDTDVGIRKALFMLRQHAQQESGQIVAEALKAFMAANQGALPSDIAQLVPYLPQPEDAVYVTLFQRNDEALPPILTNPAAPETVWVFKESPQVDPWFKYTFYVGQNGERGMTSMNSPAFTVEEAVAKYFKASGAQPTDASQLVPYLKDPVPPAMLEDIFNGLKKSKN